MPFVEVKSIQGVFDPQEKAQVIAEITEVFARMKGDEFANGTWVVVSEIDNGSWGEGGTVLKAEQVPDASASLGSARGPG